MEGIDETFEVSRFNWTTRTISNFRDRMAYFISFLNKPVNDENFSILCNLLFNELINKIPVPTLDVHVSVLIRSRPNDGENLFSEEWQISYNSRETEKINPGRFNGPRQPMFYACAP